MCCDVIKIHLISISFRSFLSHFSSYSTSLDVPLWRHNASHFPLSKFIQFFMRRLNVYRISITCINSICLCKYCTYGMIRIRPYEKKIRHSFIFSLVFDVLNYGRIQKLTILGLGILHFSLQLVVSIVIILQLSIFTCNWSLPILQSYYHLPLTDLMSDQVICEFGSKS